MSHSPASSSETQSGPDTTPRDEDIHGAGPNETFPIGEASSRAGVSERALRYYQELGLLSPGCTAGGSRRYCETDLVRVARIRELQQLLGLNLDEIATVLSDEDRVTDIRAEYRDERTDVSTRHQLLDESLALHDRLRSTVQQKRDALDTFLSDLDRRIEKISKARASL